MKFMHTVSLTLLIAAGLHLGIIGALDINVVDFVFGEDSLYAQIIYGAMGIAALYGLYLFKPVTEMPMGADTFHNQTHIGRH